MTDEDERPDYLQGLDELRSAGEMYEEITDEEGLAVGYEHLEPDPDRWAVILQHDRFHGSMTQFDNLMADYDHDTELHVGPESFRQVNHESQSLPDELNFYIAEDREEFTDDVNHPLFREVDEGPEFTVPKGSNIGLAFGSYRDTIDVDEEFDYLDVRIPTAMAHSRRSMHRAIERLSQVYGDPPESVQVGEEYIDTVNSIKDYVSEQ
ncbi:MAG: hypothetical protein ABEK04_03935 [Candidatus Nanohalobium sp.]